MKLSIIIPCFNEVSTIKEIINKIKNQTSIDKEIINNIFILQILSFQCSF